MSIALCNALGIPARYVSGYAVGLEPPDFHSFFEVYLEYRWFLFDATRMAPVSGLVRIGIGRDAADASFANIVGLATMPSIKVEASAVDWELTYRIEMVGWYPRPEKSEPDCGMQGSGAGLLTRCAVGACA
ncbi:transglutaminase-like domain-containing protein [Oceanobacter antarcticus]|uniref:Transglutaminase domain-containing protein n=1 Tax=Oceanobacter antarcticus TaxID=3133425 RepID=A0ABW8NPC5_9GAMM